MWRSEHELLCPDIKVSSMSDTAISVRNLGKSYHLGVIGRKTLQDELHYWWLKARGKDPRHHMGIVGSDESSKAEDNDNNFWALKNVSFDVKKGEVLGIIGRNGAGKSTLLKILTRITEPTEGEAVLEGRVASLLEVGTGFHAELTGRENIFLNGSILGMKKDEIRKKFDDIVDFAEISEFIDTPVKRYSSGMYVRLAFAVAAHLEPEIMLVDEVLAVGDVAFQKKCLGKMKDVAGEGRTVLFVSHNMTAINNLCGRALLVEKGKLIMDSVAEEVTDRYLGRQVVESIVAAGEEINERMEGIILKENPFIRPEQVSLLDNAGNPRKVFDADMPINVSVTFKCFRKVPDMRVIVTVVDKNNVPVYGSQNTDDTNIAAKFSHIAEGTYRVTCVIPANTFGNHRFYLTVQLLYPKIEHIVLDRILEFEVRFGGYNRDIHYGGNDWPMYVWPKLNWRVEPVL